MKKVLKILSVILMLAFSFAMMLPALPVGATSSAPVNGVERARDGVNSINDGNQTDLMASVRFILNTVFIVVGIITVIVIIIGGINYTTSQGDPGKVKKAKDTILYGVIGLVVALLAFAIVTFVLQALAQ